MKEKKWGMKMDEEEKFYQLRRTNGRMDIEVIYTIP